MQIRAPKDFWSGLVFVAFGTGFILLAQQYRLGTLHRMGPGMFPTLVGGLLAALGVAIALRSLVLSGEPVPRLQLRPLAVSVLAIALFGVTLQWLGLVAAIAVLVLVGGLAARDTRPLESAALAAVMILFSVGVFVWLLGLPLRLWPDS
ncbi:MAG: tripartite tricarboxylate transporter TctB family protein [Hyphomicrobiales bacterium]|nr:tripartite tricarboxylate transporter TctB family protein [Hyphomicrobiales bacterium]